MGVFFISQKLFYLFFLILSLAPARQEGGFVETTTSLTSAYNFPKFLQEQQLGANIEADGSKAISTENQRINNVKVMKDSPR